MAKKIYQIQIELRGSKPGIWRRLLVQSDLLLSDFHKVIQTTMGWTNSHLHQFIKGGKFYAIKEPDPDFWEEMNIIDYKRMVISDLLLQENDEIIYEYDFGDSWEHILVLEKILDFRQGEQYPICIGGRMNCPPEDCGGIPGYLEMLGILKHPEHKEYQNYIKWLGGEFDPLYFNRDNTNMLLERKDYGINEQSDQQENHLSQVDFEGYSPYEMHKILYEPLLENNPIQLLPLTDSDYLSIPILNQVKYLAKVLAANKEIKLTNKGFLPTRIVSDIYKQGFMKDVHIESGISKLYKETDSICINLPRILLELSGLTKKRNNKLSLTKKGEKIISDNDALLRLIFQVFAFKFNWAYYDGYGENNIGQFGYAFSLILLGKYGHKKQTDRFYSDKYFKAFPQFIHESIKPDYESVQRHTANCYSIRTFKRFLDLFGLIKIEQERAYFSEKFITKTDLFDKLIKILPPGTVK